MTVDDCIAEYKTFGQKVFGRRRYMQLGGVPWHKFNATNLEEAIKEVTARHSEKNHSGPNFPMSEDVCRWYVNDLMLWYIIANSGTVIAW